MKIVGEQLVLPRNFEFIRRLPARFEILVIGKGAVRPEGSTFEIEIMGQRLTLRSKVDLKPGARYELEKQSATEFRISREIANQHADVDQAREGRAERATPEKAQQPLFNFDAANMTPQDLWKLQAFTESGAEVEQLGQKYRFDFEAAAGIKGLFVPVSSGGYALLLCGAAAGSENISAVRDLVSDLQIRSVARVDAATFEHIAAGAIDFSG